jgi:malonyl-CoA O-methyltransferase
MSEEDDPFRLERARVRASFERASASYESAAGLQGRVAAELLGRLETFHFSPQVVLDLGAGTGRVSRELAQRYPRARVVALDLAPGMLREARRHQSLWRRFSRVCGDALRLPLRDACVDLVFSSLMLQWCEPLDAALAEVRRVLRPGGFFAFSTFGVGTLMELREAWAQADGYNHVNHFPDVQEIGDAALRAGLAEPVLDVDRIRTQHPDVLTLMRELKAIGAHNVTRGRARSLTGRSRLAAMQAAYETKRRDGQLPASWEIVYGASWGREARGTVAAVAGVAHIAPGSIGRRRP